MCNSYSIYHAGKGLRDYLVIFIIKSGKKLAKIFLDDVHFEYDLLLPFSLVIAFILTFLIFFL